MLFRSVDTSSATGYVLPKGHLLLNGINPVQAFTVQDFAGSHDAVCTGVFEGKWDVGATFSNQAPTALPRADGCENALGAARAGAMQVVFATDEIPNDVLVVSGTMSAAHTEKLAAAAKKLGASEDGKKTLAAAFLADGVADISAADFAPVKKALEAFAR